MASSRGLTDNQRAVFEFLKEMERLDQEFTADDIAAITKYTPGTLRTNLGVHWRPALIRIRTGVYKANGVLNLTETDFKRLITQSPIVRNQGTNCKNPLAEALVQRSQENMVLALELYNRFNLPNKLDAFLFMFCAAWEQLLKAQIIEEEGEDAVFKAHRDGMPRQTIGLRECLDRLYLPNDLIRKNLERIKMFRDLATHLYIQNIFGVASRLFQAGLRNYELAYRDITGTTFLGQSRSHTGILTLFTRESDVSIVKLKESYGPEVAGQIMEIMRTIEDEIKASDSESFAMNIEYLFRFANKKETAEVELVQAENAPTTAVVLKKVVDAKNENYPCRTKEASDKIDELLKTSLTDTERRVRLCLTDKKSGFIVYDFLAIVHSQKWKNANNQYHWDNRGNSQYSEDAIFFITHKIETDRKYLERCRNSYKNHRKS